MNYFHIDRGDMYVFYIETDTIIQCGTWNQESLLATENLSLEEISL